MIGIGLERAIRVCIGGAKDGEKTSVEDVDGFGMLQWLLKNSCSIITIEVLWVCAVELFANIYLTR